MARGDSIGWAAPPSPGTSSSRTSSTSSSSGGGGSGGGSGGSGGGGGGGGGGSSDPYARARADAKAAERKAAARYQSQAEKLTQQANALKVALGTKGFRRVLRQQLAAANLEFGEENSIILGQYERGKGELEKQKSTAEDNRARSLQESVQNSGRERNEAMAQGIEHGVSATDMLKAQAASLRNWAFNAGQVQSNYTDEINSLQSEHAQMVNSVITARQGAWREREQQRVQAYRQYRDNRSSVMTEVGNKLGESSQYWDMANEQESSSTRKKRAKTTNKSALAWLKKAALETGKGYTERKTPTKITGWTGSADLENSTNPNQWATQELEMKDAEGATLRRWQR